MKKRPSVRGQNGRSVPNDSSKQRTSFGRCGTGWGSRWTLGAGCAHQSHCPLQAWCALRAGRTDGSARQIQFRKQGESMTQLDGAVRLLKAEHGRLTKQIRGVSAALSAFGAAYGRTNTVRRKMSAAGRARIVEAQRLRWAKVKNSGQTKSAAPKKRTMSAAARKKIAAAQRARWAKVRAQRKAA